MAPIVSSILVERVATTVQDVKQGTVSVVLLERTTGTSEGEARAARASGFRPRWIVPPYLPVVRSRRTKFRWLHNLLDWSCPTVLGLQVMVIEEHSR